MAEWIATYDTYGGEVWFGGEGEGCWEISTAAGNCYLGGNDHEAERVARLIAAAPTMLDALRLTLGFLTGRGPGRVDSKQHIANQVAAAIAKATPTQQEDTTHAH